MPNRFGIDLGQRRDVVGVLAFLERPELRVGRVDGLLDVGRRLRAPCGMASASSGEQRGAGEHGPMTSIHHYPPSFHEKLYLNENCTLNPSLWNPSEKFSRRPHWNSPPIITFGTG